MADGKSRETRALWGNGAGSANLSSNGTGCLVWCRGCIETPRRNIGIWVKCECCGDGLSKHVIGEEKASPARSNSRASHTSNAGGVRRTYSYKPGWACTCEAAAANTWEISMPGAKCKARSAMTWAMSTNKTARRVCLCPGPHFHTPKRRAPSWLRERTAPYGSVRIGVRS